jgi:hypothetical protein
MHTNMATGTRHSCLRCHGSGEDPRKTYGVDQWRILGRLMELSAERREHARSHVRTSGARGSIYDDIRAAIEDAVGAGIVQGDVMTALDITNSAYHKIRTGRTG